MTKPNAQFTNRQLYARLLVYVRPYWRGFAASIACMGLSSIVEPVFPALMKKLLDNGFSQATGSWDWLLYPGLILCVLLARSFLSFVGDYAMSWVSNHLVADLRRVMFERIIDLPVAYFGDNASGNLMSRVAYDVAGVAGAASGTLTTLVKDCLSVIGLTAWLLYLNWKLSLVTVALVPFIAIATRAFGDRLRRISRGLQHSQGEITQVLQEAIEGYKVVKVFGGQEYERQRFTDSVQRQRRLNMRCTVAAAALGPIVQFFSAIALAVIMAVALHQASHDQTTVGDFVSFITAMLMLLAPLKRLTDVTAPIQRGLASAESIFEILDEPQELDTGKEDLGRARGCIEFENVTFSYPGAGRPALKQVSFSANPGECVALVGQSGSGKSTIANLLPRFYTVDQGQIRIDGHPLDNIALMSLRSNIALVTQDVVLFNDTIAANIAYGLQRSATLDEIRSAAQAANALEFIDALPQGLNAEIGDKGVKLSGGQRQRIAIARALLKDAPILILDEATSALDTESERYVQAALETLMKGRTTIVIAHRLSTIENADRIAVMLRGEIVETGSHAELLAADGAYAQLYRLQFSASDEAA